MPPPGHVAPPIVRRVTTLYQGNLHAAGIVCLVKVRFVNLGGGVDPCIFLVKVRMRFASLRNGGESHNMEEW